MIRIKIKAKPQPKPEKIKKEYPWWLTPALVLFLPPTIVFWTLFIIK
jgi:hypothetical protein